MQRSQRCVHNQLLQVVCPNFGVPSSDFLQAYRSVSDLQPGIKLGYLEDWDEGVTLEKVPFVSKVGIIINVS